MTGQPYTGTYWEVKVFSAGIQKKLGWYTLDPNETHEINGFYDLQHSEHRISGYKYGRIWYGTLAWDDEKTAKEQFKSLLSYPQKYQLKLVRCDVSHQETMVM